MISFIVCSIDRAKSSKFHQNVAAILKQIPWEIIVITDARSLAEGYQRGIAASQGETLVLCHDDIEILTPDFGERLLSHLKTYDVVGLAGTTKLINGRWISAGPPYIFGQVCHLSPEGGLVVDIFNAPRPIIGNIQAMDGLLLVANRNVFDKVNFDAIEFDGFHLYDIDFTYAAYRAGLRLAVAADLAVVHASGGKFDAKWQLYCERFEKKWMPGARHYPRHFQWTGVRVASRADALAIMNPPYWTITDPHSLR